MAKLLYQGHGSYRLTAEDGTVIYVDPYAGKGYDVPAALILVTHEHSDHNHVELPAREPDCAVITQREALQGGSHRRFTVRGVTVEAVEARNRNHDPRCCVGYLLELGGVKLYAAGDTSRTKAMERMKSLALDWALLPIDGVYNMDAREAGECARLIGARHVIPIHMKPGALFDRRMAEAFEAPGRRIVEPGEEIEL